MSEAKAAVATVQSRDYADYEDVSSEYSTGADSPRQALNGFGSPGTPIGGRASPKSRSAMKNFWRKSIGKSIGKSIAVRARRKLSMGDVEEEVTQGLLGDSTPRRRKASKTRPWYIYYVFGGLGCLSFACVSQIWCCDILTNFCASSMLLALNLALGIANMLWPSDIDKTLQNWGKPGTGTEGLDWYPSDFLRDVIPIPCHSHNDYWRHVPLFSALRAGCTGVEADVWLFDDDLYVGHNTASLTRNRTFTSLYVNPLVKILEHQNPTTEFYNGTRHGVFDTDSGKSLTLLVDVKTGGTDTWQKVLEQLQPLRERGWLSYVQDGVVHEGPITVVGTGNTRFDLLTKNQTYRDAFFDAPLDTMWEAPVESPELPTASDIDDPTDDPVEEEEDSVKEKLPAPSSGANANVGQGLSGVISTDEFNEQNSYYASVAFSSAVGRMWRGRLSPRQMRIIRGQIRGAHRRGLKVRYWDMPSWPLGLRNHVWDVLVKEGVDMLNVDDLRGVSKQVW
jgi:hypothetical protein